MDPKELRILRKNLMLTQQEMASAIGVSFVTYSRWEKEHRVIAPETAKLLDIIQVLIDKAAKEEIAVTLEEIKEAILDVGIFGVVSHAAVSGILPDDWLLILARAVPELAWIAKSAGIYTSGAQAFFSKSSTTSIKTVKAHDASMTTASKVAAAAAAAAAAAQAAAAAHTEKYKNESHNSKEKNKKPGE